mmetsp:Transcript_43245/g.99688  ORF Transcript_43245/g.99688 Transcript_43245/m.99688 type:complete len:286 (-) Transcript_43245:129-986(-)
MAESEPMRACGCSNDGFASSGSGCELEVGEAPCCSPPDGCGGVAKMGRKFTMMQTPLACAEGGGICNGRLPTTGGAAQGAAGRGGTGPGGTGPGGIGRTGPGGTGPGATTRPAGTGPGGTGAGCMGGGAGGAEPGRIWQKPPEEPEPPSLGGREEVGGRLDVQDMGVADDHHCAVGTDSLPAAALEPPCMPVLAVDALDVARAAKGKWTSCRNLPSGVDGHSISTSQWSCTSLGLTYPSGPLLSSSSFIASASGLGLDLFGAGAAFSVRISKPSGSSLSPSDDSW